MKKRILSIILSLVLIIGTAPLVFAETASPVVPKTELTEQQKVDRDAFLVIYNQQKEKLDALKEKEKTLVTDNNALSKEIRTILQGKYKDKAEKVKGVGKEIKALAEQARTLNKERIQLKSKGKGKKNNIDNSVRIAKINEDIKAIRAEIASINNGNKKDKEELKALKAKVQVLLDEEKSIREQIEKLREEKETYWTSFKADLESLKFAEAGKDYTNIVETKASIVDLLTQRQTKLKDILVILNSK